MQPRKVPVVTLTVVHITNSNYAVQAKIAARPVLPSRGTILPAGAPLIVVRPDLAGANVRIVVRHSRSPPGSGSIVPGIGRPKVLFDPRLETHQLVVELGEALLQASDAAQGLGGAEQLV
jgi:hypothetical protein